MVRPNTFYLMDIWDKSKRFKKHSIWSAVLNLQNQLMKTDKIIKTACKNQAMAEKKWL